MAEEYEYSLEQNNTQHVYGSRWWSQTFTPQTAHVLTSVQLKCARHNSPGALTVSIRAAVNGKPVGGDLCSGSVDANAFTRYYPGEWYEIGLGEGCLVEEGITYAIVARCPSGGSDDMMAWYNSISNPYPRGVSAYSNDAGGSWIVSSVRDMCFICSGEIPEPEPEPEPEPPPDFCAFIRAVGVWFIDLSLDIRELWLIGDFLATPFEWVGELFLLGATLCCALFASIDAAIAAVEAGITPAALLTILEEHWPTLYYFITDPADWFESFLEEHFTTIYNFYSNPDEWFTTFLEEHFTTIYNFATDPTYWFESFLEEHFTTIYNFATDPADWFLTFLEEHFTTIYYLIVDPQGEILYLIGQAFDLTPYEAQSPEFIIKTLFERWLPELYLLWRELQLWLGLYEREGAVGVMGEVKRRFYDLAERALRFLVEGVW